MTVAMNLLASHYNRPRVEAWNVGDDDLLAHSVVEVVESSRPESATTLTIGGGRTLLHVKAATQDSPRMTTVVGPSTIRAGKTGSVYVSNESYAKFTGSVSVGDVVGVASGEVSLRTGQTGWSVAGDIDTSSAICRVMRLGGGGASGPDIGILVEDVDHLDCQDVQLLLQQGECDAGETIVGLSDRSPQVYVTCINITGLTLRAGTVEDGPYMIVEYPNAFDMPNVFPRQIEECLLPNFEPDNGGV